MLQQTKILLRAKMDSVDNHLTSFLAKLNLKRVYWKNVEFWQYLRVWITGAVCVWFRMGVFIHENVFAEMVVALISFSCTENKVNMKGAELLTTIFKNHTVIVHERVQQTRNIGYSFALKTKPIFTEYRFFTMILNTIMLFDFFH